jgi:N-acetylglucosaminyldiphosphoundecaprenol N-acetyl-beta-D-mannosaminyltransferase
VRPPIAILGIPFDNVTVAEAVAVVDAMVSSGRPHYLATANVDFLVQALRDVELRRILLEAHLVICDGTPLVWASRLLGNPLPERVAGSDLVPLLIRVAAEKGYRLFFLGASPDVAGRAIARLKSMFPELVVAGQYSPPYSSLLEMDHEGIKRRIVEANPDLVFVGFGCPKQEKWINMHYRTLGVPVCVGIGGTIDFLAGHLKRAPRWMQKSGTEWLFRLAQEPRRLFRRYVNDLWVFGWAFAAQLWRFRTRKRRLSEDSAKASIVEPLPGEPYQAARLPSWFDIAAVQAQVLPINQLVADARPCVLDLSGVEFIDSTGVGALIRLHKDLRAASSELLLVAPSAKALRALSLLKLERFFTVLPNEAAAAALLKKRQQRTDLPAAASAGRLMWSGEVTSANAEAVWEVTKTCLGSLRGGETVFDLSQVPFIDSSGLGLLVRARKYGEANGISLRFTGLQPAVQNVVHLARLQELLLTPARPPQSPEKPPALASPSLS